MVNLAEGVILQYVTWLMVFNEVKSKAGLKATVDELVAVCKRYIKFKFAPPRSVTRTVPPTPFGWLAIPQPPMPPWPLSQWSEVNWNGKVSPVTEGVALAEPAAKKPTTATAIATDPSRGVVIILIDVLHVQSCRLHSHLTKPTAPLSLV